MTKEGPTALERELNTALDKFALPADLGTDPEFLPVNRMVDGGLPAKQFRRIDEGGPDFGEIAENRLVKAILAYESGDQQLLLDLQAQLATAEASIAGVELKSIPGKEGRCAVTHVIVSYNRQATSICEQQ